MGKVFAFIIAVLAIAWIWIWYELRKADKRSEFPPEHPGVIGFSGF